jgi:hypothetical protein
LAGKPVYELQAQKERIMEMIEGEEWIGIGCRSRSFCSAGLSSNVRSEIQLYMLPFLLPIFTVFLTRNVLRAGNSISHADFG